MRDETIIQKWVATYPIFKDLMDKKESYWANPKVQAAIPTMDFNVSKETIEDAASRLQRFAPYIAKVFPETSTKNGLIESPVTEIADMKQALVEKYDVDIPGKLLLKQDNALPISGSIKARGGIYEVLKHAEKLATEAGLLSKEMNYEVLATESFKEFFSNYKIAVGSTGNLGLSIGIMSAQLGFQVTVHMSQDAKQWKKDLLREKGVMVIEYVDDYSKAVEEGRKQAKQDPACHFVDDENSLDLFNGYAVAGERVREQFEEAGIVVDAEHPLFVYLPCGVGGGPGGVAFGLKHAFGEHVHCLFAEPTHSPCMLLGMMTDLHEEISVQDIGLDNVTAADGLAVGTASGFVGKVMEPILTGCYTISDETMFDLLSTLNHMENIQLEPSALAGMTGPVHTITQRVAGANSKNATHLVWATGGNMVPREEMAQYIEKGNIS